MAGPPTYNARPADVSLHRATTGSCLRAVPEPHKRRGANTRRSWTNKEKYTAVQKVGAAGGGKRRVRQGGAATANCPLTPCMATPPHAQVEVMVRERGISQKGACEEVAKGLDCSGETVRKWVQPGAVANIKASAAANAAKKGKKRTALAMQEERQGDGLNSFVVADKTAKRTRYRTAARGARYYDTEVRWLYGARGGAVAAEARVFAGRAAVSLAPRLSPRSPPPALPCRSS